MVLSLSFPKIWEPLSTVPIWEVMRLIQFGATSIRALSDDSYVVGMTVLLHCLVAHISTSPTPADGTYAGNSEMYIAKFTTYNTRRWGTYIGGNTDDQFNDLEVLSDGRVAFAGFTTSPDISEVGSAAGKGSGVDALIGVLSPSGHSFRYLDQIGGNGTDKIHDIEVNGSSFYFTGETSNSNFPTGGTASLCLQNGTDIVVGKVDTVGTTGYKATFFGTTGADIGSCIKAVSTTNCAGQVSTFLLAWGTVAASGMPVVNIGGPFYQAGYQGGQDMFFGGFNSGLTSLLYGTYIGGSGK